MEGVDIEFFTLCITLRKVISFIYQTFYFRDRVPLKLDFTFYHRFVNFSGPLRGWKGGFWLEFYFIALLGNRTLMLLLLSSHSCCVGACTALNLCSFSLLITPLHNTVWTGVHFPLLIPHHTTLYHTTVHHNTAHHTSPQSTQTP